MKIPLLHADNLAVHFPMSEGLWVRRHVATLRAVEAVHLSVQRGETLGIVGESGCGKSTTGRALLQLLRPTAGRVVFDGTELTALWRQRLGRWHWTPQLRDLRRRMQIIFQDPLASLDPRMTVHSIIAEPLEAFAVARGAALSERIAELLTQVGLSPDHMGRYPHQFSGGQRQRVGIARALALQPDLIVADEPISALDVSIQAQILNLLQGLQTQLGLTYIFISHDLAAVRHLSHHVAVMYLGRVVESAPTDALYKSPAHPYTQALLAAVPHPNPRLQRQRHTVMLTGEVPSPLQPPPGCPFHPRCPMRIERCVSEIPQTRLLGAGRSVACHVGQPAQPAQPAPRALGLQELR